METQEPQNFPFKFAEPQQFRIYERLLKIGPGPAAFFRDACVLIAKVDTYNLESTSHLVGHLAREIEESIREVLLPLAARPILSDTQSSDSNNIKPQIVAILEMLEFPQSDPIVSLWFQLKGRDEEDALHKFAHRRNLSAPRPIDQHFLTWWGQVQTFLESILERFETHHLKVIELLDGLLAKSVPTSGDIKTLKQHVPNNLITYGYFFDRLQSPAWLRPLHKAKFFLEPLPPTQDKVKGTISFPFWPQSRYLVRMADKDPERVFNIMLEIPETANQSIHGDLAEAAAKLPASLAARWVQKELEWLKNQRNLYLLVPEKLGSLIPHLTTEDTAIDLAVALAGELLQVLPLENRNGEEKPDSFKESQTRFWIYEYEQIVEKSIPALFRVRPETVFRLFCQLLERTIRFSASEQAATVWEDHSYIWCQAIEGGGSIRQPGENVRDLLVFVVRDMAEKIVVLTPDSVGSVINELESYHWTLFCRLALHLLRLHPDKNEELISARLTNKEYLNSNGLWHEYFLLLKERFPLLPENIQEMILTSIKAGPDLNKLRASTSKSPKARKSYKNSWQRLHLIPIKEYLSPKWKMYFKDLIAQPEPEHPDFMVWTGEGRWGWRSPKPSEELQSMSVAEVLAFLSHWVPPPNQIDSTAEGLVQELKKAVMANSMRFTGELEQARILDPVYVRAFISAFHELVQQKQPVNYSPVLDLCMWVVSQPKDIPGRKLFSIDQDPNWGWTRSEITRFLDVGFEAGEQAIPFEKRFKVWPIIEVLTEDPEPTPQQEARDGGSIMDPSTLSLNVVRGQAMHSVIRYAVWVRRHLEGKPQGTDHPGFEVMPEVERVLNKHLDPTHDPSLAIRSIYGQWLPTLAFLDRSWVEKNKELIFPEDVGNTHLGEAAWNSFVVYSQPTWNMFDLLADEYKWATSQVGKSQSKASHLGDPQIHLAHHLMFFYWTGKISLETNGLIGQFFRQASPELRGHTISFIGSSLYHTKEPIPVEVLERLKRLWESRIEHIKQSGEEGHSSLELVNFGWWFASAKFDSNWSIKQLQDVLKLSGRVEANHLVVEQLACTGPEFPVASLECLEAIIASDKEGWGFYMWKDNSRSILSAALQSKNEQAQQAARQLINKLSARGHLDFRDLLGK